MSTETISCTHTGSEAILCRHLFQGGPETLYFLPATNEDLLQSWCEHCEQARIQDQGWYDAAWETADFQLLCQDCCQALMARCTTQIECEDIPTPEARSFEET
jgi:hypothetical protein